MTILEPIPVDFIPFALLKRIDRERLLYIISQLQSNHTQKTLKNTKAKIFFKSLHKLAYLKKPNDFGRSNTQAVG
ncbi:hypothetical protein [Helicobacter pylori]|uniref:hypothetical protein n=1 Tax=Helicobacter pylori TaxID=210 RepID=UPI000EAF657F|nr:hypothetical protein [Helicobacter pylori]